MKNAFIISTLPQNGEMLTVNFVDENLSELSVPLELLLRVHLMRCNYDYAGDCTAPGGMATDFNIFGRAFDEQELEKWTSCRWEHTFIALSFFPMTRY